MIVDILRQQQARTPRLTMKAPFLGTTSSHVSVPLGSTCRPVSG